MESSTSDNENPYLAMRAAKMARNEAHLAALGLTNVPLHDTPKRVKSMKVAATTKDEHKKHEQHRRSSNLPRSQDFDSPLPLVKPPETKKRPRHVAIRTEGTRKGEGCVDLKPDDNDHHLRTYPDNSARSLTIDIQHLVFGRTGVPTDDGILLGKLMANSGKAFVMEETARRSGFKNLGKVSFNKYSGIQEWGNAALFLWVNFGAPKSEVVNEFLDGGREVRHKWIQQCFVYTVSRYLSLRCRYFDQLTWFGGSKAHEETRAIKRLLHIGKMAANGELDDSEGLLLWGRQFDTLTKSQGPYVCLGRLAYKTHYPRSRPLKFIWRLLDFEQLMKPTQLDTAKQMILSNQLA